MPGMGGGMPAGMEDMMAQMMADPEMMQAMQNPKVVQAMQSCMGNPMAAMQYMNDPEACPALRAAEWRRLWAASHRTRSFR